MTTLQLTVKTVSRTNLLRTLPSFVRLGSNVTWTLILSAPWEWFVNILNVYGLVEGEKDNDTNGALVSLDEGW